MSYNFERHPDAILAKYKVTKKLGRGAYGTVFNAIDKVSDKRMAIKRVEEVFSTTTDARRALREISIMRLCKHPNIVVLKEVHALPDAETFQNLWVVMEYGGYDLGKIIKHCRSLAGWSALHVRFISWQILAGLNYLHSANIAHRDLKPSNILVTEDNHVSLIDFGLARQLRALDAEAPSEDKKDPTKSTTAMARKLTQHVVTRWYRPPELILLQGQYSPAVDVWSFGCIFGELVKTLNTSQRGGPLFPGRSSFPSSKDHYKTQDLKNELSKSSHQLTQIFNMIGTPAKDEIAKIKRTDIRQVLSERSVIEPKDLSKVFLKAPAPAVQILGESLKFDPEKRSLVSKLLVNPWFKDVVDRKKMFKASSKMRFPFEDIPRLPSRHEEKDRLRKLIIKEIALVRDGVTE